MAAPAPAPAAPTTAESVIPDAGVYGAQSAAALNAYNNATAQAAAQRNQLYNQYGLTNSGQVDINNQGGQYQQMLGAQGQQFNADQQDAQQRHLGQGGLANQQLGQDRNAAGVQDFGFQQQVGQVSQDYNQQMQAALNTEQGSDAQAYQDAMNVALQNQLAALQSGTYSAPGVGNPGSSNTPAPKPPKGGKGGKGGHGGRKGHKGGGGGGGGKTYAN